MSDARTVAERHLAAVREGDPAAMAADYHADAVLVRGQERYEGRDRIAAYFETVPDRLGGGRVDLELGPVEQQVVTVRWRIRGGPADGTRGHDVLTITEGAIEHQVVYLDDRDF